MAAAEEDSEQERKRPKLNDDEEVDKKTNGEEELFTEKDESKSADQQERRSSSSSNKTNSHKSDTEGSTLKLDSQDVVNDVDSSSVSSPYVPTPSDTDNSNDSAYDAFYNQTLPLEDSQPLGTPINQLVIFKTDKKPFNISKSACTHRLLFDIQSLYNQLSSGIPSYPSSYQDKWDDYHVRMPCSTRSVYGRSNKSRWDLINQNLSSLRSNCSNATSYDIEEAIMSYNDRRSMGTFDVLHTVFNNELDNQERQYFTSTVLPEIIKLALGLPYFVTQPLPLMKTDKVGKVSFTQLQAASLLANAFFCTFPDRQRLYNFPSINFDTLFTGYNSLKGSRKVEKVKCLLNYFQSFIEQAKSNDYGIITIERRVLFERINWRSMTDVTFGDLCVSASGTIEDEGKGCLEADFANKYLGGGAMNTGLVQEEIRFMICPELILTRLICQVMSDKEAVWITGCQRFSSYSGYANTFQWSGPYKDDTVRDSNKRMITKITAIDAIAFHNVLDQFRQTNIDRELHKALVGFGGRKPQSANHRAVATGNWGCGAFRGDIQLKSIIQMMATAAAGRNMCYFTFGDVDMQRDIHEFHRFLIDNNYSVGQIYSLLMRYDDLLSARRRQIRNLPGVFTFIRDCMDPHSQFIKEIEEYEKEKKKQEERRRQAEEERLKREQEEKSRREQEEKLKKEANRKKGAEVKQKQQNSNNDKQENKKSKKGKKDEVDAATAADKIVNYSSSSASSTPEKQSSDERTINDSSANRDNVSKVHKPDSKEDTNDSKDKTDNKFQSSVANNGKNKTEKDPKVIEIPSSPESSPSAKNKGGNKKSETQTEKRSKHQQKKKKEQSRKNHRKTTKKSGCFC